MNFTKDRERKFRKIQSMTLAGLLLGLLYPLCADGFDRPVAYVNGLSIGGIGGFLIAFFEVFVFAPWYHKYSFILAVIIKSLVYSCLVIFLILFMTNFNESIFDGITIRENFYSDRYQTFLYDGDFKVIVLYSFFCVGAIIFTREMNRKMGQGVLLNFITGKYHRPRDEERIFLFIDQKSSTELAEIMTSLGYYKMLREFYFDVTKCILNTSGEIYRYVGDQVVISWAVKEGLTNANCIRCYYSILNEIDQQKEKYLSKYERLPKFRASLHIGHVIRGEIGDVKSQIVFHGETLYETQHIEDACREKKIDVLVSEPLIDLLQLPAIYQKKKIATIRIPQSNKELKLYTVEESELCFV